jgi:ATP-dependent DNA helicase RecQ
MLEGLTVVVSPLIALMKDQVDQLTARGVAAARLDSSLTAEEHGAIMDRVRTGELRLLYSAPERFNNERFREAIVRQRVAVFAVDEAHCVSEWGHNFRPDYLKLAVFADTCGAERTLALTATATPQVLDDICAGFRIDPSAAVRTSFYRPNLELLATPVRADERDGVLLRRIRERPAGSTIVYVTLQRTAEEVAERLAGHGVAARPYHAGMKSEDRTATQEWFLASETAVVVATIAFGMGIDKRDIRSVYHYNLAKSLEGYSQEIGRAGRDGQASVCETLASADDLATLANFAYGDTPDLASVHGLLTHLVREKDRFHVAFTDLAARHDIRVLVVRTLVTYLELEGFLEAGTPFYERYRFRPLVELDTIASRFKGERKSFLETLFASATKAHTWYDIDLLKAVNATGSPRDRIVRALDYLDLQQLLEVRVAGLRHRFRWLQRPSDPKALARHLHDRMLEHEAREIARLEQVVQLVTHDGCQTAFLCDHFGETLASPCGHCSWCLRDGRPLELPPVSPARVDETVWQRAMEVRNEHPAALGPPRAFARFLTGLSSPRLTRARLTGHELFGGLAGVPFPEVLAKARVEEPPE